MRYFVKIRGAARKVFNNKPLGVSLCLRAFVAIFMAAGHGNTKKVERADIAYKQAIGMAQDAKEKRDVLRVEFTEWMKEFL